MEHQDSIEGLPVGALKPRIVEFLRASAAAHDVSRLILYGSRARGDFKELSDIDLAFQGGRGSRFYADLEENLPTLLRFDLVDLAEVSESAFRDNIVKEGVVLYDREQAQQLSPHLGESGDH